MITRATLGLLLLLSTLTARAQRERDTAFYRTTDVPDHLRPIDRAVGSSALGNTYFYGEKKLSSPYSLEVPFFELNDPQVNHSYRNFRTWTTISRLAALPPLILFFTRGRNSPQYWTVVGGSTAVGFGATIVANTQVNRAVARYNTVLRQARPASLRLGAAFAPTSLGTLPIVGVGAVLTIR